MKQLRVLLPPPLDRMLVHRRVTPSSISPAPILNTWVDRDNVGQRFLSKETKWQGSGLDPPTFRSEVQHANHHRAPTWQIKLPMIYYLLAFL